MNDMEWVIPQKPTQEVKNSLLPFGQIEQQILYNRGYWTEASASAFLNPEVSLEADPFLINEMENAVERVILAIERDQKIFIYGDYDADGVTAAALLSEALRAIGAQAEVYFPDRFSEGYGLNRRAIERIAAANANLLITVDCGVRAIEEVAQANNLGLDVIVTDHHLQSDSLPEAFALLNPHRIDTTYPNEGLAGVGVAYKLAHALYQRKGLPSAAVKALLDFVAIGTIADMVPLRGENRSLVKMSIKLLSMESTIRTTIQRNTILFQTHPAQERPLCPPS